MPAAVPEGFVADAPAGFVPDEAPKTPEGFVPDAPPSYSLSTAIPAPGERQQPRPAGPQALAVQTPDAFPVSGQQATANIEARTPELTPEEAEQMVMTPNVQVPRFGKPGTLARGVSELISMPVEAITAPASPLITTAQLVPGLRELTDMTLAASMTKSGAQRLGEASVTGDKEQYVRGVGELVLGALAAKGGAKPAEAAEAAKQTERMKAVDQAALEALRIKDKPAEAFLPESAKELEKTGGTTDAIQDREAAQVPVEVPPGDRPEVGTQVREQTPQEQPPKEAPIKTPKAKTKFTSAMAK